MRAMAVSEVLMPSAAMAAMIRNDEISPTATLTTGGTTPTEFSAASNRKPNRNTGGAGRASPTDSPPLATHQAMPAIAGRSVATRSSLVMMASVRICGPMVWPAPATCATSWMAPPRNTPISCVEKPSAGCRVG